MIKLSHQEKMSFVYAYIENEIDLSIINEISNEQFEKSILQEFESLLALSKLSNLVDWHKSLDIPNLQVDNLQERIIETPSGNAIIGIRFLGMNINMPFVSVWANFNIENEIGTIETIAKEEFKIFSPKYIRFWVKPNSKLSIKHDKNKEQSFYINSISEICKQVQPLNYNSISLKRVEDLEFLTWYHKMYSNFHIENPKLKFLVVPNSNEEIKQSLEENLIFFIIYNGKKIGLISAIEDEFLGEKSLYIMEIVIQKDFKGKKFATAAQRKYLEIFKNKYKYVWGMISTQNIPSSKNALSVGRKIISTEYLIPI